MDSSTGEYLSLVGSAPLILLAIEFVKLTPWLGDKIVGRMTPLVALVLAALWGWVLNATDHFEGDLAAFIVSVIMVASSATGLRAWSREFSGKTDPKP